MPPEMSHHSTHPVLCRASQADATCETAASPQAQGTFDCSISLLCGRFGCWDLTGVQGRIAMAKLTHPPPISLIPSFPQLIPFRHSPRLLHPCSVCCNIMSQVSRPYTKRSPKSCHRGYFAITGCVATSQLLSEMCRRKFSAANCWLPT